MLDYTQLENHAQYMVEDATALPSGILISDAVNHAGRLFYSMHPWNFREADPATVDLVKDQAYIDMPADFQSLIGLEMTNALTSGISLVTMRELVRRRSTSITVKQSYYWAALTHPRRRGRSSDWPQPRLEVWPTPAADSINVVTLLYRIRWENMPAPDTEGSGVVNLVNYVAPLPEFVEIAFLEVLRAIMAGWGERLTQPQGGVTKLLRDVREGPVFEAAISEDGLEQYTYGPMIGGGIQSIYPLTELFSTAASSSAPS